MPLKLKIILNVIGLFPCIGNVLAKIDVLALSNAGGDQLNNQQNEVFTGGPIAMVTGQT